MRAYRIFPWIQHIAIKYELTGGGDQGAPLVESMSYYFYKSGPGNCFLPYLSGYARGEKQVARKELELPGLYVGFDDHDGPETIASRIEKGGDREFEKNTKQDDDYIAHIFHKDNRNGVKLIAFDKRHLVIMQIPPDATSLVISKKGGTDYESIRSIVSATSYHKNRFTGLFSEPPQVEQVKFLPVTVKLVVPRDSLYLSVDSLSVFRYLNQGTCRPIRSIGTTDQEGYPDLNEILGNLITDGETPYGAFMRLYLDGLMGSLNKDFREIINDDEKAAKLILATLNPILFETLAFYLCLDLDLIPEAANGKGLDVIDVRARAKTEKSIKTAHDRLQKLGVTISEELTTAMKKNQSLSIQCKAYSGDNAQGRDFLMFRRGNTSSTSENVLLASALVKVLKPNDGFSNMNEFINSQIRTLRASLRM